jgi:methylmalonyl-CoA carboxyltransferase large subunit
MSEETVSREEFDALRLQLEAMQAELAQLRSRTTSSEITPEVVEIIAAAVAAFLGKRATIRFIRRANEAIDPWRTQGRVSIQAARQIPQTRGLQ